MFKLKPLNMFCSRERTFLLFLFAFPTLHALAKRGWRGSVFVQVCCALKVLYIRSVLAFTFLEIAIAICTRGEDCVYLLSSSETARSRYLRLALACVVSEAAKEQSSRHTTILSPLVFVGG